jgi:hypothetical protein
MTSPGRCSAPAFSPLGYFTQVAATAVQEVLRGLFARWGLPRWVRVDNGYPWGNFNDLPTVLALWLLGLGVQVHWNDPCHPEQNPKVERSQGTGSRWAEPWTCRSARDLQRRFDREDRVQREWYPAVAGRGRLAAFPDLAHSGRRYTRGWERRHWDLGQAVQQLAAYQAVRKVSTAGHVGVYDTSYYVGRQYAGQSVYVQLDPEALVWVVSDPAGRQVRTHAAKQITRARIRALNLKG